MKKYFGEYIREQAIKNLLSAQARIAEKGSASEVISLTKFVLKSTMYCLISGWNIVMKAQSSHQMRKESDGEWEKGFCKI